MKLFATLTTLLVGGLASVHAQHHLPPSATSNANINGGIKSPTNGNVDIDSVATIIDEANDTERKLHDMLTSVKDVIEEKYGLDLIDALALGGNGTRRLSSKTNKSGKAIIDGVDDLLLALVAVIVLLLVEFFGLGGGGTITTSTQAATTSASTQAATTSASTTSATTSATTSQASTSTTSASTTGSTSTATTSQATTSTVSTSTSSASTTVPDTTTV